VLSGAVCERARVGGAGPDHGGLVDVRLPQRWTLAHRGRRGIWRCTATRLTVGSHTLRHAFITAALDAGVPLRDVQEAHLDELWPSLKL